MNLKKRKILKFKNYKPIIIFLKKFNLNSFNDNVKVKIYLKFFELSYLIKEISEDTKTTRYPTFLRTVKAGEKKPFTYELSDLCRLHWIILSRKALNTLEYGSGFSTIFMADACYILSHFFNNTLSEIRVENKFHVYALEESLEYLKITKKRVPQFLSKFVSLIHSKINLTQYDGRFVTTYSTIPDISPDFIYLDGPSTFVKKRLKGFSINNISRFPMSSDLLTFEYFLEPGTFIIVDGRTANSRFLKDYFKRKWKYYHDIKGDCHYFELNETPLGPYNKIKLKFCLGDKIKFF